MSTTEISGSVKVVPYDTTGMSANRVWSEPAAKPEALPAGAWLGRSQEAVQTTPELIAALERERGLSSSTARRFGIGYDGLAEAWVLPVYNGRGKLVNVVNRPHRGGSMYWRGFHVSTPRRLAGRTAENGCLPLYPAVPTGRTWLLAGGEWDALAALQAGLPACTGLLGCKWNSAWDRHARGKRIAVVYDVGEEAAAARTVDRLLAAGAAEAWAVTWPSDKPSGFDVCDWFLEGRTKDQLVRLIKRENRRQRPCRAH